MCALDAIQVGNDQGVVELVVCSGGVKAGKKKRGKNLEEIKQEKVQKKEKKKGKYKGNERY